MVGCYASMDYLPEREIGEFSIQIDDIESEEEQQQKQEEQVVVVGSIIKGLPDVDGEEQERTIYSKTCCRSLVRIDGSTEVLVVDDDDVKLLETTTTKTTTKVVKEKRLVKDRSSKKPPRPPRSSKPLSLDAADQKLIKEISQLIILKRARVERMKALKKIKSAKASSLNANLFAIICTILFCFVFIFQGFSSGRRIETTPNSEIVSQGVISSSYGLPISPPSYASMKLNVE